MPRQSPKSNRLVLFVSVMRSVTELTSLALLIGVLFHRQRQHQCEDERTQLSEVGNPGFSPASAAVMQLYREGKLLGETSLLRGKNLMGANWQRVILPEVNLEGANLRYADLSDSLLERANITKTDFRYANLREANLSGTKMAGINFMGANLKRAILTNAGASHASFFMTHAQRATMPYIRLDHSDLQEADFHGADMRRANLSNSLLRDTNLAEANLERAILTGTKLINANLTGANLSGAFFDEKTILPDAQFVTFAEDRQALFDKYWTSNIDMTRYTNRDHPDFWQPEWVKKYEWVKKNYEED